MALRARYGPGNRAWSYQRPAEDTTDGAPPLPSAFGLTLSADEHTPVPESRVDADAPTQTAADAARNANGTAKARGKNDGASAARAARAAKASAARSARASGGGQTATNPVATVPADGDSAPRRRSGRVPATTAKARGASPTHTTAPQRTVKRKRSTLVPDAVAGPETDAEAASQPPHDGVPPSAGEANLLPEQAPAAPRAPRASGAKRPRVSQKDLDVKPPRGDEGDDARRTTFGSTTSAPDPFTALSVADLVPIQEQSTQTQVDSGAAAGVENPHGANFRRLPPGVPVHRYLSGLYRRYPVSQVGLPKEVLAEVPDLDTSVALPPTTIPNAAPFLNLYAPRRTRGIGADKHGLCPICAEPPSRGGRGKAMMLNMKTITCSMFMVRFGTSCKSLDKLIDHLSVPPPFPSTLWPFFYFPFLRTPGLSPKTGLPFSPPIAYRSTPRKTVGAREKATLEEGLCHACARWIVIEGVKAVDVLVPEIYWWKHASTCHKSRMLDGEGDFYTEDALFKRIVQWQRDHPVAPTRASTTTASLPRKEEPMDIDLNGPTITSSRTGATTPVRPNADEPDSSPLSSLDGTDGTRVSPEGRKASAPTLPYPPTSRGPFGPPSPSARAKSAETSAPPPPGASISANSIRTPQLANHALPGTLPGTPQTTASITPVLSAGALPAVAAGSTETTDAESRSVVDSGVALSPHEQPKSVEGEMDGDAEAEGEDEDAEGEDDPTATAENTPVISQLPVLTPMPTAPVTEQAPAPTVEQESVSNAAPGPAADTEQSSAPSVPQEQPPQITQDAVLNAGQELASQVAQPAASGPDLGSNLTNPGQDSIDKPNDAQQESLTGPMEGLEPQPIAAEPQVQVPEDVQMADAPIAPVPATEPTPAPVPELQVAASAPVEQPPALESNPPVEAPQQETVPAPVPAPIPVLDTPVAPTDVPIIDDVTIPSGPTELPVVQGMDMYANSTTPNAQDTAQLLTDIDSALASTDLALATGDMALDNGLTGAEMSLVGEEIAIPGVGLDLPTESLEPIAAPILNEQVTAVQEATITVSSGAGTPNAGESDPFAFWNA
ncbi:hypothetical protein FRC11_003433 [Ceratobasidium sp. 423]|nr:hypothetical protein FRC11_003433 [Ceratobasidium sp. 423]